MSTELLTIVEKLIQPIVASFGFELVDLELKGDGRRRVLRVFIDKPGGIVLDDCAEVSREIDALFEVEDPIPGAYTLEVSSPGLDRPLKSAADFARHVGRLTRIKTTVLLDPDERGHKRKTFIGELLALDDDRIRLRQTDRRGGEVVILLADIAKANLEIEF